MLLLLIEMVHLLFLIKHLFYAHLRYKPNNATFEFLNSPAFSFYDDDRMDKRMYVHHSSSGNFYLRLFQVKKVIPNYTLIQYNTIFLYKSSFFYSHNDITKPSYASIFRLSKMSPMGMFLLPKRLKKPKHVAVNPISSVRVNQ